MHSAITHIFFDLDGSLLTPEKAISTATLQYLQSFKQRKKVKLGIATGRNCKSVQRMLQNHHVKSLFDYLITDNGSELFDLDKSQHSSDAKVEVDAIRQILEAYQFDERVTVAFHNSQCFCANRWNQRVQDIMTLNGILHFCQVDAAASFEETARVMILFEEKDRGRISFHPVPNLKAMFPVPAIYEYMNQSVSKLGAIKKLTAANTSQVMVFGDAENDLEMLVGCGMGVAMLNASEEVKQQAKAVTPATNQEDGIIKYLMKHENLFEEIEDK